MKIRPWTASRMKQQEARQKQRPELDAHRPLLSQEVRHAWEHIHIAALQNGEGRQRAIVHEAVNGLQLACTKQALPQNRWNSQHPPGGSHGGRRCATRFCWKFIP